MLTFLELACRQGRVGNVVPRICSYRDLKFKTTSMRLIPMYLKNTLPYTNTFCAFAVGTENRRIFQRFPGQQDMLLCFQASSARRFSSRRSFTLCSFTLTSCRSSCCCASKLIRSDFRPHRRQQFFQRFQRS